MKVLTEITDEGYPDRAIDTVKIIFLDEEAGTKSVKYLSAENYAAVVRAGIYSNKVYRVGMLPAGYYDAAIAENETGFVCKAILTLPKRIQHITYMKTAYEMEMPPTVFAFEVSGGRVECTRVFCMEEELPLAESALYQFPLGNVAPGAGTVCWGANELPTVECLKDLEKMVISFWSSPFNSDHYRVNENCQLKNFNLRDLCEYVQAAGTFDEKLLMPISQTGFRTLGELQKTIGI